MVRRSITLAIALSLIAASTPSATWAALGCQDSVVHNRFVGFYNLANTSVYGVKGTIRDRTQHLCTTDLDDDTASSIWVMLAGSGVNEYAQAGYWRFDGATASKRFIEYNDGETGVNWVRVTYEAVSPGSTHNYLVAYSFGTHKIYLYIDTVLKGSTSWHPDDEWTPQWQAQWFAETWDAGDDVAGYPTSKADMTNLASQKCVDCSYTAPLSSSHLVSDTDPYNAAWIVQPTSMNIWNDQR